MTSHQAAGYIFLADRDGTQAPAASPSPRTWRPTTRRSRTPSSGRVTDCMVLRVRRAAQSGSWSLPLRSWWPAGSRSRPLTGYQVHQPRYRHDAGSLSVAVG